jgi:predicted DNA-binding transcriptional regulator YafY
MSQKDRAEKLARVLRILYLLNQGRVSIHWLAREFKKTIRTIERDLQLLREAGFDIVPLQTNEPGWYVLYTALRFIKTQEAVK